MKKILFILTLMIGFAGTAQDSIKRFRFQSGENSTLDRVHLFSEDLNHCNANVEGAGDVETFTYNSSSRVLSLDGSPIGSAVSTRRGAGLATLFSQSTNIVNVTNGRGGFERAQTYNASTNTWD